MNLCHQIEILTSECSKTTIFMFKYIKEQMNENSAQIQCQASNLNKNISA